MYVFSACACFQSHHPLHEMRAIAAHMLRYFIFPKETAITKNPKVDACGKYVATVNTTHPLHKEVLAVYLQHLREEDLAKNLHRFGVAHDFRAHDRAFEGAEEKFRGVGCFH